MVNKMKKYKPEFKLNIVKEYFSSTNTKNINEFADENQIPRATLGEWVRNYNKIEKVDMSNTSRSYKHKFYKPEIKIEGVRYYLLRKDTESMRTICQDLGIGRATLNTWIKAYSPIVQQNLTLEIDDFNSKNGVTENVIVSENKERQEIEFEMEYLGPATLKLQDQPIPGREENKKEFEVIKEVIARLQRELIVLEEAGEILSRVLNLE